jgi:hypothetical protein
MSAPPYPPKSWLADCSPYITYGSWLAHNTSHKDWPWLAPGKESTACKHHDTPAAKTDIGEAHRPPTYGIHQPPVSTRRFLYYKYGSPTFPESHAHCICYKG